MKKTCNRFPSEGVALCTQFIDTYGDAMIALVIQEADPKTICPEMKLCPKNIGMEFEIINAALPKEVNTLDVSINTKNSGSEKCPLCLMAVQAAKDSIKSDTSVVSVFFFS